jgi:hypothetical protein
VEWRKDKIDLMSRREVQKIYFMFKEQNVVGRRLDFMACPDGLSSWSRICNGIGFTVLI